MSAFVFSNNVKTTLASPITSTTATTCTLSSSTNLPTLSAGQFFAITFNDVATGLVYEICYCTARTGAVLTIVRGQEGTTAQTWLATDLAYCSVTAGMLASFIQDTAGAVAIDTSATAQTKAGALTVTAGLTSGAGLAAGGAISGATTGAFSGAITAASATFSGIGSAGVPWIGTDGPATGLQFNVPTGTTNGFRWLSNNATVAATLSITGGFETGLLVSTDAIGTYSAPAMVSTGDVVAQRSTSTGALIMGGGVGSGTLDYNITHSGYLTVNQPFSVLESLESPVSGMSGGDICATRSGSASGVLFLGGSTSSGFIDYGLTTGGQFSCSLTAGGYATINATAFTTHSDSRAKTDMVDTTYGLAEIMKLRPKKYTMKNSGEVYLGFSAQDVGLVIPEAQKSNDNGDMLLHMDSIFTALLSAFQQYVLAHP